MKTDQLHNFPRRCLIPLWVKVSYSVFAVAMVTIYWHEYGPQNFLYFCDTAVLVTLVGIWLESPLLIGMETVSVLFPQIVWTLDVVSRACGFHLLGMTDYMFDPKYSVMLRGISLFHAWMPALLLWLVYRLGYDRRALKIQTVVGSVTLLICCFCFVPPGTVGSVRKAVNINCVFGLSDSAAQTRMPPLVWLGLLIVGIPILIYLPTHRMLLRLNSYRSFSRRCLIPEVVDHIQQNHTADDKSAG